MSSQAQFEELVKCSVCLDRIQNPKLLPCQHSICLSPCLKGLADSCHSRRLKCPECRAEHLVPAGGVEKFPTNLTLVRFLDLQPNVFNSSEVYNQQTSQTCHIPMQTALSTNLTDNAPSRTVFNDDSSFLSLPRSISSRTPVSSEHFVPEPMRSFFDLFLDPPSASTYRSNFIYTPQYSWVRTSGKSISSCAFVGGRDKGGDLLYVGRAEHSGSLTPGKVNRSHGVCYISWGGKEHAKQSYEILEGTGRWVQGSRSTVPSNAIKGGKTEDGEILYIGRVSHSATLTIGKVQASHGVCYIPFDGKEIAFRDYEILTE